MWANSRPTRGAFFDMHGNVGEWTADRYQAAYPTGNPVVDPTGASGSYRVVRGGAWYFDGPALRSAKRDYIPPERTATTSLASVLVSNSNSKGAMYGRMTGMAERKGGAGRAWTKGAVAQKGHARHAEPRRKEFCHREG